MSKNHIRNRIDLLEEHIRDISEKTSFDSVSDNSFFSYRHANRLFKSIKGESINSFSTKIRIQTAAEYLKYSSLSISEIALKVAYESTASFSKAFKKLYGQAPSDFRRTTHPTHILPANSEPYYRIEYIDELSIEIFKTVINTDSNFEEYYHNTRTAFHKLNSKASQWMLLWDEDPGLCQVSEIRYFIGLNPNDASDSANAYGNIKIEGRYAIFDSSALQEFDYAIWHELVIFLINLDARQLRETHYIEWFSKAALNEKSKFYPYKIGVPIR